MFSKAISLEVVKILNCVIKDYTTKVLGMKFIPNKRMSDHHLRYFLNSFESLHKNLNFTKISEEIEKLRKSL